MMDLLTQLRQAFGLGAPASGMDWYIPTFQGNFYPWLQNFQTMMFPGFYGQSPQQFNQGSGLAGGYDTSQISGQEFFQIPASLFNQPLPPPPTIQSTFDPTRAQVTEAIYTAPAPIATSAPAPVYQQSAPIYQPPSAPIYQPPSAPIYQPPPQLPQPPILPTIQSDLPTPRQDVNQSSVPGYRPSFDLGFGVNPFSLLKWPGGGMQQ